MNDEDNYEFAYNGTYYEVLYGEEDSGWRGIQYQWTGEDRCDRNKRHGEVHFAQDCGRDRGSGLREGQHGESGEGLLSSADAGIWRRNDGPWGGDCGRCGRPGPFYGRGRGESDAEPSGIHGLRGEGRAYVRRAEEACCADQCASWTGRYTDPGWADQSSGFRDVRVAGGVSDPI